MKVAGRAAGGSHSVAWTDALGGAALMMFVIVCGGLGVGLVVVYLLGLLGLPVDVHAGAILHRMVDQLTP